MSDAQTFLAELCAGIVPGECQELRTFHRGGDRGGKPGPRWFGTDAAAAQKEVNRWPAGLDGYYGPNPRRRAANPREQTGKKSDVSRLRYVIADVDDKLFSDGAAGAAAAIAAFPLVPTWVIRSGGGYQVLWSIESIILAGPDDPQIATFEGVQSRIYQALGNTDPVQDIGRVLRLPGTRNYKYPDAPEVVIRHHDPEARYRFEEFASLFPAPEPAPRRSRPVQSFDDASAEELREMLRYVDPQPGYAAWVRVLAAIHSAFPGPEGVAIAEEWSPGDERNSVEAKFRSFGNYRGVRGQASLGTIVYLARQGGWKPTPRVAPVAAAAGEQPAEQATREAKLAEENALLREELIRERQARQRDRKVHLSIMATLKQPQLSASERLTAIALAIEVAGRAQSGEADDRGGVVIRSYQLAQKTAQSVDTCRKHVNTFAEMGIIEKETRSGGRATYTDPITGQEVTKPVSDTIIVAQGKTVVDILDTFIAAERPTPRNHGGKRESCPRCGSLKTRTVTYCGDCDLILKETTHDGDPGEQLLTDDAGNIAPIPVEELAQGISTYPRAASVDQSSEVEPRIGDASQAREAQADDNADDWNPYWCNHPGCARRLVIGQRYCGEHRHNYESAPPVEPLPIPFTIGGRGTASTAEAAPIVRVRHADPDDLMLPDEPWYEPPSEAPDDEPGADPPMPFVPLRKVQQGGRVEYTR